MLKKIQLTNENDKDGAVVKFAISLFLYAIIEKHLIA